MQRPETASDMAVELDGEVYLCVSEVAERIGVSRQTLWRWRTEGEIPTGHRYRGGKVVFSLPEVEKIEAYAHRLEPVRVGSSFDSHQLRLFNGGK
jgi:excisionase family DNA binding protein